MLEIKTSKDLKEVKKMDIIKVFSESKWAKSKSEGYFSGIFKIKNKKYFSLSTTHPSKEKKYDNVFFLSTSLYEIQGDKIIFSFHTITGYCRKDNLEDGINGHIKGFKERH